MTLSTSCDSTSLLSSSDLFRRSMTTSLSSSSASLVFLFFCPPVKSSTPLGPTLKIFFVMNGSSGVPEPVVLSGPPPNRSESTSLIASSPGSLSPSPLPPPKRSLRLIILPIIPSSPGGFGFFFSSSFGNGTPRIAFVSIPSSDDGIEGDASGRDDVPSPFILRSVRPLDFLVLELDLALFSFSSYNTIPGSAFFASWAAVVSGCQLACRCTIFHLPPIFLNTFVVKSLLTNTPPCLPLLSPAVPLE